jgi:hypothetical protein
VLNVNSTRGTERYRCQDVLEGKKNDAKLKGDIAIFLCKQRTNLRHNDTGEDGDHSGLLAVLGRLPLGLHRRERNAVTKSVLTCRESEVRVYRVGLCILETPEQDALRAITTYLNPGPSLRRSGLRLLQVLIHWCLGGSWLG